MTKPFVVVQERRVCSAQLGDQPLQAVVLKLEGVFSY
jgi:hypothetical protein